MRVGYDREVVVCESGGKRVVCESGGKRMTWQWHSAIRPTSRSAQHAAWHLWVTGYGLRATGHGLRVTVTFALISSSIASA